MAATIAAAAARRDNLDLFVKAVAEFQAVDGDVTLPALLAYLTAEDDQGNGLDVATPTEADSVKLLTVHRAKGLEWDLVAVVGLTGADQPDAAIFLFRLASLGGVALIMYYVPKLAEMQGWDPARAQWISAANPLFIISFVASGHNDSLMVGFMVAAIYAVWRGHGLLAWRVDPERAGQ